jgi:hypothetical protein
MMLLRELMDLLTCSPRSMAKLLGKAQHQFRSLEGVRPFSFQIRPLHRRARVCV